MMPQPLVSVVVEDGGQVSPRRTGVRVLELVEILGTLAGARDVTMIVSHESVDEQLMIAIDGSDAFIGLERPDGLFQFVSDESKYDMSTRSFTIGGQRTDIEARYLVDAATAATVVREWLEEGEASTRGGWERQ
jgi:hypothetical protein